MLRRHLRQNTRPLFYVAGPSRFVSGMISGIDRHGCGRTGSSQSRAVIIYEDNRTLGIGAEVSAIIAEQAFGLLGRANSSGNRSGRTFTPSRKRIGALLCYFR
jgi:hypothetical protein